MSEDHIQGRPQQPSPAAAADVASAVAAAVAPAGPFLGKRIEFHIERKPYSPISSFGAQNFHLETLNPSSSSQPLRTAAAAAGSSVGPAAQPRKRSEGGGLDPVFGFKITFRRIGAGLQNLGNTCFLNSVLQCLTYTEPFAAYCHSGEHRSSCRNAGFCAMCALQNHVMNALQSSGKILSPFHLVKNLRCISRNFRNSRQEDAHEYMVNLLESMHKCCLPSGVPTESPGAYERSLVHKIFGGRLRSQVKCTQCNYCSNKFDPFLDLSLEIYKADSLRRALAHFTAREQLDGGQKQYQCQRCKEKVRAYKQLTVHKAPYVLTIHLKRFGPDIPGQKIDKKVDFEPTLDLKPFVSDPQETDLKYTLYGVLVHAGWSTHSGHYYCFVRTSSGMWHSLDDNQVRPVSEKIVLAQKAYMLFYVRDRSSALKKSADGVRRDNMLANAPGCKIIPCPESVSNGTIHNAEMKFSMMECTSAKCKAIDTSHGGQPISMVGNASRQLLSSYQNFMQKESLPGQNNGHTTQKEVNSLQVNGDLLSNGMLETTQSKDCIKLQSVMTRSPLIATSTHNQKNEAAAHGVSQNTDITMKMDIVGASAVEGLKNSNDQMTYVNGFSEKGKPKPAEQENTVAENDKCLSNLQNCKGVECLVELVGSGVKAASATISSVQQEVVAATERESSAVKGSQTETRRKKLGRSLISGQYLGSRHLFLKAVFLHKKKKHKRSKKHRLDTKKVMEGREDIQTNDQEVSTSQPIYAINVPSVGSLKKRSRSSSNKEKNSEEVDDGKYCNGNAHDRNLHGKEDVMLATSGQPRRPFNAAMNQCDGREEDAYGKGSVQNGVANLLMSLKSTVPRWDDVELPSSQPHGMDDSRSKSIGYVLDEWDEEYDHGKRKKVKKSNRSFGGPNPFQEVANMSMQQRNIKLTVNQVSSGNQPLRI